MKDTFSLLQLYLCAGLSPIPLKPLSEFCPFHDDRTANQRVNRENYGLAVPIHCCEQSPPNTRPTSVGKAATLGIIQIGPSGRPLAEGQAAWLKLALRRKLP